jgi:dTDP-glucose 4,6-dehydratase
MEARGVKNLLLTGGCGFIGAAVCRHVMQTTDWNVTVLDKLDEAGTLNRIADLRDGYPSRLRMFWHDLRAPINPVMLRDHGRFDYVAHLAAASHVDRSIIDPTGYILDNVLGTGHLLDYVRNNHPDAKTLVKSTDEVFGPAPSGVEYDEYSAHCSHNPYAASKAGAEALCPAYAITYGMQIVVSHCTNVFGRTQYREKFVPLVAEKVKRGELVQIHTVGGKIASRYYLHVSDAARAVVTILERGGVIYGPGSGKYNITGDREYENLFVAQRIADTLERPLNYELIENPPNRPRPDARYALSGKKLEALGWQPEVPFEVGLRDALGVE